MFVTFVVARATQRDQIRVLLVADSLVRQMVNIQPLAIAAVLTATARRNYCLPLPELPPRTLQVPIVGHTLKSEDVSSAIPNRNASFSGFVQPSGTKRFSVCNTHGARVARFESRRSTLAPLATRRPEWTFEQT